MDNSKGAPKPSVTDKQVLIVDDNLIIAMGMQSDLEDLGFTDVVTAGSTAEAFALLTGSTPSVALLDMKLEAGQTSEAIAVKLRGLGVPFAFVSGYGEVTGLLPEFNDVTRLTKPASGEELVAAIDTMLAGA